MENEKQIQQFFSIDYLRKLNRPEEALTDDVWNHWRVNLLVNSSNDELLQNILDQPISNIAPRLGINWENKKKTTVRETIREPYEAIYNAKYKWYRRACVLTIARLHEQYFFGYRNQLERLYHTPKKEVKSQELTENREKAKNYILHSLTEARKSIYNDADFELCYRQFLKEAATSLFNTGNINTKQPRNYAAIYIYRFFHGFTIKEIANKMSLKQSQVNAIINKLRNEFNEIFSEFDDRRALCSRWQKLHEHVFNTLDASDLKERNRRLNKLNFFQKTFVAKNLGDYIK